MTVSTSSKQGSFIDIIAHKILVNGTVSMTACPDLQCSFTIIPPYRVLKYAPIVNKQTDILSTISERLHSFGVFTNTITKSDFENKIGSYYYDMFFYFGEGYQDCMVDENFDCIIYANENLKDKWIVMSGCDLGYIYARQSVRDYNAVASIGYALPMYAQFSNYDFIDGFGDCFIEAQKTMLNADILNEDTLLLAYNNLKNLYYEWSDYYRLNNDFFAASLFRANAASLVYYSKWDIPVTINIDITPSPAEIYHFGSYIGNAPLSNYEVMSGGNVFKYKAIGCFDTWFIINIPKTGGSYTLTPMAKFDTGVEDFSTLNVYLEYNNIVKVSQYEADIIKILYRNYGDTDQNIPIYVNNSKNYPVVNEHFYQGNIINVIKPHGISLNQTFIHININDYPPEDVPYTDVITITVNMDNIIRSFDVTIHVFPLPPQPPSSLLSQSMFVSDKFTKLYEQYTKMTRIEQITKNILINGKMYSPEDIIKEIAKGSEIGVIFI